MPFTINLGYHLYDIIALQNHIKSYNTRLNTIVDGLTFDDIVNLLHVYSSVELTEQDIIDINTVVQSYTNPPLQQSVKIETIGASKTETDTTDFKTIWTYRHTHDVYWKLLSCVVTGYMFRDPMFPYEDYSFVVRVVDVERNIVLGSQAFTNQMLDVPCIVECNDFQQSVTHSVEVQVKKCSPRGTVVLHNCAFTFGDVSN